MTTVPTTLCGLLRGSRGTVHLRLCVTCDDLTSRVSGSCLSPHARDIYLSFLSTSHITYLIGYSTSHNAVEPWHSRLRISAQRAQPDTPPVTSPPISEACKIPVGSGARGRHGLTWTAMSDRHMPAHHRRRADDEADDAPGRADGETKLIKPHQSDSSQAGALSQLLLFFIDGIGASMSGIAAEFMKPLR